MSWGAVADANGYIVTFSLVQGTNQQGLCSNESHTLTLKAPSTTVSVTVGGDVESTDVLRVYTTYEVTVVAVGDVRGTSSPSQTQRVLSPQTSETDSGIVGWQYLCMHTCMLFMYRCGSGSKGCES